MNNKSVLITGTSTGFGRRLVTEFLRASWLVVATLRNAEDRKELFADELTNAPGRLFILSLDVAREQERAAAAEFIDKQLGGRLDCLVNNAGFGMFGAFEDLSEAQIREQMEVNFFGLALLTRDLLPALRHARGRVINISSVLGYTGMPLSSLYCASKFAVEGLSESLYYELQPHGVQVALVEPGAYRTGFRTNIVYGEKSFDAASAYKSQFAALGDYRNRRDDGPGTPIDSVINAVMRLSAAEKMPLRVRCGKDAKAAYVAKRLLPAGLHRIVMSKVYEKLFARRAEEK